MTVATVEVPQELEPFTYFDNVKSVIAGLGGVIPRPEIHYAFHTHYVRCAQGQCTFTVDVSGLTATHGTLYLNVHMLSTAPGSHARLAVVERVPLAELARTGGRASVRFPTLRGMTFALYGAIREATDARATDLKVWLDRPGSEADEVLLPVPPSPYVATSTVRVPLLTSNDRPSLVDPMSQVLSTEQFREPTFARWADLLGEPARADAELWEVIYALRVMERYGLLEPHARAMLIDAGSTPFASFAASRGVSLDLVAWRSAENVAESIRSSLCDAQRMAEMARTYQFDDLAALEEIDHVDFIWARRTLEGFGAPAEALRFAQDLMERLRLGGTMLLTTHVIEDPALLRSGGPLVLTEAEMQRLALNLVAYEHQVAMLRFDRDDSTYRGQPRLMGLIARRGL